METIPAIRAIGLHKNFKATDGSHVRAVDGVDLTVMPGEIVAFLGPNGAGKTTTVDMLLGLTAPSKGAVEIHGMTPRAAINAGRVSAMMQTGGLLGDFTVHETVQAIATLHRREDRIDQVLEQADLTKLIRRKVQGCSGGEQQRLRFALALLPDPQVIILDEPTTGMDVESRNAFWRTMREDAATGRTIVFATHYLAEADEFAQRTILMAKGRVVADGPTAEVRAAFGGRTVSFAPPAEVVGPDGIDPTWLTQVSAALAPFGVGEVTVASASLEAAFLALTSDHGSSDVPSGDSR